MGVNTEPYEISTITAGFLEQKEIKVVHMPRETFMEIVTDLLDHGTHYCTEECAEDCCEDHGFAAIRDEILPVAQEMVRFPVSEWLEPTRGCGCVVGEYLVATSELDRAALVAKYQTVSIEAMLSERPNSEMLIAFGNQIDTALLDHVEEVGFTETNRSLRRAIDAIEIVD